jgi:hypothetical protein
LATTSTEVTALFNMHLSDLFQQQTPAVAHATRAQWRALFSAVERNGYGVIATITKRSAPVINDASP